MSVEFLFKKFTTFYGELQITVSKIHGNPRIVTFEEPAQMIPKSLHACHPLVGEHA
jgi:hypothetical protein